MPNAGLQQTLPIPSSEMFNYVPYKMFSKIRNCGDAINPYIIEHVSGLPSFQRNSSGPHILGIGSIFFYADTYSHVWGSGIMNPASDLQPIDTNKIHALRGKLSFSRLREVGYSLADVPLGDPGVFVADFCTRREHPKFSAAIIPHHHDFDHPVYDTFKKNTDVTVVDMMDSSLKPLEQLADAEVVISQSLHGLVFAEALGIPSLWIAKRSDDRWTFKFRDWYSTTRHPQLSPWPLESQLSDMIAASRLADSSIDLAALRGAFPSGVVESLPASLIGHDECKKREPVCVSMKFPDDAKYRPLLEKAATIAVKNVKKVRDAAFAAFSMGVYSCIGEAEDIDQALILAMTRMMDEHSSPVMGTILPRSKVDMSNIRAHEREGFSVTTELAVLGDALLIRPHGRVATNQRVITFII